MAYPPLSKKFVALTSVPADLQALYNQMAMGKAKTFLGLLLATPAQTLIGTLDRISRIITLSNALRLMEVQHSGEVVVKSNHTLTRTEFDLGFRGVRATLRFHQLDYGVWSSPDPGLGNHPRPRKSTRKIRLWAGIVDKRVPLLIARIQSTAVA